MPLHLEGVPCPRRAIREYLADTANMERILEKGLSITASAPLGIEAWKAMDEFLQLPEDLTQQLRGIESTLRWWYSPKFGELHLTAFGRLKGFPVPLGRTMDETAQIMRGCRKYLLLRIWQEEKGETDNGG